MPSITTFVCCQSSNACLFGHASSHDTLLKIVLQRKCYGEQRKGRQRKTWNCNIDGMAWCSVPTLVCVGDDRERCRCLITDTFVMPRWHPLLQTEVIVHLDWVVLEQINLWVFIREQIYRSAGGRPSQCSVAASITWSVYQKITLLLKYHYVYSC